MALRCYLVAHGTLNPGPPGRPASAFGRPGRASRAPRTAASETSPGDRLRDLGVQVVTPSLPHTCRTCFRVTARAPPTKRQPSPAPPPPAPEALGRAAALRSLENRRLGQEVNSGVPSWAGRARAPPVLSRGTPCGPSTSWPHPNGLRTGWPAGPAPDRPLLLAHNPACTCRIGRDGTALQGPGPACLLGPCRGAGLGRQPGGGDGGGGTHLPEVSDVEEVEGVEQLAAPQPELVVADLEEGADVLQAQELRERQSVSPGPRHSPRPGASTVLLRRHP